MSRVRRIGAIAGAMLVAVVGWVTSVAPPAGATPPMTFGNVPAGVQRLNAVACPSSTTCVAVGYDLSNVPLAARSTDGGVNWTTSSFPQVQSGQAIACPTLTHCVVASDFAIDYSDDGGVTWTHGTLPTAGSPFYRFYGVACATASVCVADGIDFNTFEGMILTSDDGGQTWTSTSTPVASLRGASCPSATHCVVVGQGSVEISENGGQTWAEHSAQSLDTVSCATASVCVAGGTNDTTNDPLAQVSNDGGYTFTSQSVSSTDGNVSAVSCPAATVCVAGGDVSGPMIATMTDGSNWVLQTVDASVRGIYGYGISCPSAAFCIAVGDTNSTPNAGFALRIPMIASTLGIDTPATQTSSAGHAVSSLTLHAHDSWNAATLTYAATGLPAGLALDPSTGVITGTPQSACTCTVHVTVNDDADSSASTSFTWNVAARATGGYRLVAGDGGVFAFGNASFAGSAAPVSTGPVVGIAKTPDDDGYWLVSSDGTVRAFGAAHAYGNAPADDIAGITSTPSGHGYWLVGRDGGVFAFGDAPFAGSGAAIGLHSIVGIASTADGHGYWLVSSDGGVYTFGDARDFGSAANIALRGGIVGISATHDGRGYRLVASDGGVFAYGDASFLGSAAPLSIGAPIVGVAATSDDRGYWAAAADGGIFSFGDAGFDGSAATMHLVAPVAGIA